MAAEAALKYIIKNRKFTALKQDESDGDCEPMEVVEDGIASPALPWQHVASFALYKLLSSWGEDLHSNALSQQNAGGAVAAATPFANKPAKKLPENAAQLNPLMLLNQMLPAAKFEEVGRTGVAPNLIFTFRCSVENQTFIGTGMFFNVFLFKYMYVYLTNHFVGPNKKSAKKMAAFGVCSAILKVQYPPEVYVPTN